MKGDLYTTPDRPYATAEEVIDETQREGNRSGASDYCLDHLLRNR